MSLLYHVTKKRVFEEIIQEVNSPLKLLITDKFTLKIISASCKMTEMVDLNVALIECLEKKRYPFENMDALYFLTPTESSIELFIQDWEKKPIYAQAHLFFTQHVSDALFEKINNSKAKKYIRTFREIYLDFLVFEPRVFLQCFPLTLHDLYASKNQIADLINELAKSISSLCISCKIYPNIRYNVNRLPQDQIVSTLAIAVHNEFKHFYDLAKPDNFSPGTLLLLDRSFDTLTPFLHEFHYQAIINDLFQLENGKKYLHKATDGSEKTVFLDEEDTIYQSLKHLHLAECSQKLVADFNAFEEENKEQIGTDISKMQSAVANMQEYHFRKEKFGIHLSLATESNKMFTSAKIGHLATLEQDMATGFTADGDIFNGAFNDVFALISDPTIELIRKLRLVVIYIVTNGGVHENEMKKILSVANFPAEFINCFKNMPKVGVNMDKPAEKPKKKKSPPPEAKYDVSRFKSSFQNILMDMCNGNLSKDAFLSVPGATVPIQTAKRVGTSLRQGKPTWQSKKGAESVQLEPKAEKAVVYVLGGVSYAEIMQVCSVSKATQRDIFIGSTGILTQNDFVTEIAQI